MALAFWDDAFGDETYRYGTAPNAFLAAQARDHIPEGGRVVCFGEGEGRNAVWLAQQGFAVTAVEPSSAGIAKIAALARSRGVSVQLVQATVQDFAPADPFDAVVLIYLHAPAPARQRIHHRAVQVLRPGGVVILEGFTPEQRQLGRTSGGPPAVELMFTEPLLRADFEGLDIVHLTSLQTELHEGHGHEGVANIVRMIARAAA